MEQDGKMGRKCEGRGETVRGNKVSGSTPSTYAALNQNPTRVGQWGSMNL